MKGHVYFYHQWASVHRKNKGLPSGFFALGVGVNGITFSLIAAEMITDILQQKS